MMSNKQYSVEVYKDTLYCRAEVRDAENNYIACIQVSGGGDTIDFLMICCYTGLISHPNDVVKLSYCVSKSRFLYFSEDEWSLVCMIDNVSQKYLKFIVGLYKLHTNQISTSELEQLVLDNIEDLL